MKAVIVAAGYGSRLRPHTDKLPKGLIEVGGEPLLERAVSLLEAAAVSPIILVVGYRHEQFRQYFGDRVIYEANPFFKESNNMASLWFARHHIYGESFCYLHSDLLYHDEIIKNTVAQPITGGRLLVDFDTVDEEAMKVTIDEKSNLISSNKSIPLDEAAGEWTGLAAFDGQTGKVLLDEIERLLLEGALKDYDTLAFTNMATAGHKLHCLPTGGKPWIEIDFPQDLQRAQEIAKEL